MPWPFTPGGAFGPPKPLQQDANDDGTFGPQIFTPPKFDTLGTFNKFNTAFQAANAPYGAQQRASLQSQLDRQNINMQRNRVDLVANNQQRNIAARQSAGRFGNERARYGIQMGDYDARSRFLEEQYGRSREQAAADTQFNARNVDFVRQLLANQLGGFGTDRARASREREENVRNLGFDASARGASRSLGLTQDTETQDAILAETMDQIGRNEFRAKTDSAREEMSLMKGIDDIRRNLASERAQTTEGQRGISVDKAIRKLGFSDSYVDYLTGIAERRVEQARENLGYKLSEKEAKALKSETLFDMFMRQFELDKESSASALDATRMAQQNFIEKARQDWLSRQGIQEASRSLGAAPGGGGGGGGSW